MGEGEKGNGGVAYEHTLMDKESRLKLPKTPEWVSYQGGRGGKIFLGGMHYI